VDLRLTGLQPRLLETIVALGKPTVLVVIAGSALDLRSAQQQDRVGAILEAWYPGEEGGAALADVLFGDYNPAGRLPVTFYKSVDQLPPFEDYSMRGRTYRYFTGDPLYPFGYGLSYTRFAYGDLRLSATKIKAGDGLTVSAEVRNAGAREGEEVVQLYVSHAAASVPVPVRSLAGVSRVSLKPGERRSVSFTLTPEQLSIIDDRGRRVVEPGEFLISVGGKQPGFKGHADAATTGTVAGRFVVTGKATELPQR
jgi:beta-glucosidase